MEIEAGDFLCVLGPNGSGKSTLGRLLNALLLPTSGEVLVDGMDTREADHLWSIRQRVGMLFQNPDNQIVGTIVEEDVAFGPENLGIPPAEIRRRVDWALDRVGMSSYAKHPPHLLSGGQKQRVAIAGLLAMRPRCMVLDEPTSLLDSRGREEVRQTVLELNREGMTVLWVTHLMEEAMLANRVVILAEGRKLLEGTPQEILRESEILRQAHLELPPVVRLVRALVDQGVLLPGSLYRREDLVEALCALKRNT